jgi:hypothetical protein
MAHKPGKSIFMENWVGTVELGVSGADSILGGAHEYFDAPGDFPLIGFSANGKIANDQIYTYTEILTLFL